jgi:hypothetical protein
VCEQYNRLARRADDGAEEADMLTEVAVSEDRWDDVDILRAEAVAQRTASAQHRASARRASTARPEEVVEENAEEDTDENALEDALEIAMDDALEDALEDALKDTDENALDDVEEGVQIADDDDMYNLYDY